VEEGVGIVGGEEVVEEEADCQVLGRRGILFYVLIDETIL
jgi:hypothetical protein